MDGTPRTEVPDTSADLGLRLRRGDREAFDELVRGTWDSVMRYFWKRAAPEDARDLAQRTFTDAWQSVRFRGERLPGTLEEWRRYLLTCARHRWIDAARTGEVRRASASLDAMLDESESRSHAEPRAPEDDVVATRESARAVRDCLARLEPLWRSACWLHFVDGVPKREIARALDRPESTLRLQLDGVMADLRRCLEAKGELA